MKRVRRIPGIVRTVHPIPAKKRVRIAEGMRKGSPSLAIGHRFFGISVSSL
jgi:hypothetical protein